MEIEELGKPYTQRRCKICTRPDRMDIEKDLIDGVTGVEVARKYGVTSSNVSNHRPHMGFDSREKMLNVLNRCLYNEDIEITTPHDLSKFLTVLNEFKSGQKNYVKQDLGEAIAEKMNSIDTKEMAAISIPFDDFKDNLTFTDVYRRCDTCKFMIIKKGDYFNCHGQELGCGGVKDKNDKL